MAASARDGLREEFVVVWDIETQDKISNMPGSSREDQVRNLEVSCLSYLKVPCAALLLGPEEAMKAVDRAEMVTLWRDEDEAKEGPFAPLLKAFDEASVVISYNGLGFDHLVLAKHVERKRHEEHLVKVHDIFARLRDTTGIWYKLDHLLSANGLATKSADGLQAIRWWEQGERTLLQEYCEQDVRALAKLACLGELRLPRTSTVVPNYVFGAASAVGARCTSDRLSTAPEA